MTQPDILGPPCTNQGRSERLSSAFNSGNNSQDAKFEERVGSPSKLLQLYPTNQKGVSSLHPAFRKMDRSIRASLKYAALNQLLNDPAGRLAVQAGRLCDTAHVTSAKEWARHSIRHIREVRADALRSQPVAGDGDDCHQDQRLIVPASHLPPQSEQPKTHSNEAMRRSSALRGRLGIVDGNPQRFHSYKEVSGFAHKTCGLTGPFRTSSA